MFGRREALEREPMPLSARRAEIRSGSRAFRPVFQKLVLLGHSPVRTETTTPAFCSLLAIMPHFFAGDELGAIKSISYAIEENAKEWKATTAILVPGGSQNRSKAVQKLVSHRTPSSDVLVLISTCT